MSEDRADRIHQDNDAWIERETQNLLIPTADKLVASNLLQRFGMLDWSYAYSDDGEVRRREGDRLWNAERDLRAFSERSPDHATLANRIYDHTAPKEWYRPNYGQGALAPPPAHVITSPDFDAAVQQITKIVIEEGERRGMTFPKDDAATPPTLVARDLPDVREAEIDRFAPSEPQIQREEERLPLGRRLLRRIVGLDGLDGE